MKDACGMDYWHPTDGSLRYLHCKKKVIDFPLHIRDVTDQTFPGRE